MDAIASDYRLQEASGILCSSYARALESAARLSRGLNKPLYVEYDLHEWLPQKDPRGTFDSQLLSRANEELRREMLAGAEDDQVPWERRSEVRDSDLGGFRRYAHRDGLLAVTRAWEIPALPGRPRQIDHGRQI